MNKKTAKAFQKKLTIKGASLSAAMPDFGPEVETKPNCFLLPQHVPNFLHSGRLTGASVAEQPLDAEYDGKSLADRVETSEVAR